MSVYIISMFFLHELNSLFYFQLAKKGVNIVLISRSEAKLQEVSNEIGK